MSIGDLRTPNLIDVRLVAAALDVRKECRWFACCTSDVQRTMEALSRAGFPATPMRGWWRSCPSQGTPQCRYSEGLARPDCQYCRGVGYCVGDRPSSVGQLVSVAALGAERVRWAEEVLAPRVATERGVELRRVAWKVIGESAQGRRDLSGYPASCRVLLDRWVVPLGVGTDGSVVLGALWIEHAELWSAAEVTHG